MMSGLSVLAQAAGVVDPNTIGVSITSLIGSLGAAGAAVAVTYYFLGFLRTEGEKQTRVFGEFRDYHAESQRKFQDQLERLTDRHEQLQRAFQDQISRMTEIQNSLLRDAILDDEIRREDPGELGPDDPRHGEDHHLPPILRERYRPYRSPHDRHRNGVKEVVSAFIRRGERIVNRVDRGQPLLILAGIMLFLAVVAYLISDAEDYLQRKEAALLGREAFRVQKEQAIEDRKTYQADSDRMNKERAELLSQQYAIIESLKRIEESLEAAGLTNSKG